MIIANGGPQTDLPEVVLFPFDDHSLPFQYQVELQLESFWTQPEQTRIVVGRGGPGAPDAAQVVYYGSVCRVGDELWMWYLGQSEDPGWHERVCLAKGRDGYQWEKPNLGLVAFHGSRDNNLVDLMGGEVHVQACVVLYQPDDPDPARRFKMAFESRKYDNRLAVAFSADGLRWQESAHNPVGSGIEMAGGTRYGGCYYLTGQGAGHAGQGRKLVTLASYDFERWSTASCLGLRRGIHLPRILPSGPGGTRPGAAGEQVHLGAALWNRGNVLLGFYGQWHGHPSNDRRLVTIDLGLAVTNDGLHYREPIPDFAIVQAAEDGRQLPPASEAARFPALIQGQGFENIGDETLFWYAPWPEQLSDGVRVAVWPRDRLGYFQTQDLRQRSPITRRRAPGHAPHIISAPIDLRGRPARVFVNMDSTDSADLASLRVELLTEQLAPVAGYSGDAAVPLAGSSLREPVTWRSGPLVEHPAGPIRVRVSFEGPLAQNIRLYAIYIDDAAG